MHDTKTHGWFCRYISLQYYPTFPATTQQKKQIVNKAARYIIHETQGKKGKPRYASKAKKTVFLKVMKMLTPYQLSKGITLPSYS